MYKTLFDGANLISDLDYFTQLLYPSPMVIVTNTYLYWPRYYVIERLSDAISITTKINS